MVDLTLGISTCPNDTYIFGPILNKQIENNFRFQTIMDDVEVLNRIALDGALDIIKVSYGVVPHLLDRYRILSCGGALGFGCGPLVVNRSGDMDFTGKKVGVPGLNTSAFQIFKHFFKDDFEFIEMRFDLIMPAIVSGHLDAGIIIHEGRFVFEQFGLKQCCDLGDLWEKKYHGPIPLGAIVVKKEVADSYGLELNEMIRKSVCYSENNSGAVMPFIKTYAQEMKDSVIYQHIELFVNEYSKNLTPAIPMLCQFLDCNESAFIS